MKDSITEITSTHVLRRRLRDTTTAREQIVSENEILSQYIKRHSITRDTVVIGILPRRQMTRVKQKLINLQRVHGLSFEQKYHIATIESEFFRQRLHRLVEECEAIIANYHAILEEYAIRRSEIKKHFTDIDAAILSGDFIYGTRIPKAENFMGYQEKFTKYRDNIILQCRLKNPLLKASLKKLNFEVRRASLDYNRPLRVDFECLIQANNDCVEQLQERNNTLCSWKAMNSNVNQMLHMKKEQLKEALIENKKLTRRYQRRSNRCSSIASNVKITVSQIKSEKLNKTRFITRMRSYQVPPVSDFIQNTIEMKKVQQEIKYRERQQYIAKVIYNQNKRLCRQICYTQGECDKSAEPSSLPQI